MVSFPTCDEPNVFFVQVSSQIISCPICQGPTIRHDQRRRRFRHGYAWHIGVLWIELVVPRQRCKSWGSRLRMIMVWDSFVLQPNPSVDKWLVAVTVVRSKQLPASTICLIQLSNVGFTSMQPTNWWTNLRNTFVSMSLHFEKDMTMQQVC